MSLQEKLSEEELAERMVRIREQNEKIKQRRQVCGCVRGESLLGAHCSLAGRPSRRRRIQEEAGGGAC